ncbi:hypothetical protein HWV62_41404 [Athelia sp. TMB]|nr:hypothetical protein HWV62_41404 [Athelia sp. TMB]
MRRPVLTTLSDPNLRFLGHIIAGDFFAHIEQISEIHKKAEPNSMLVFNHTHLDPVGPGIYYDVKVSMVEEIETAIPLYRGSDSVRMVQEWQQAVKTELDRSSPGFTIPIAVILPQASTGPAQAHFMTAALTTPLLSDMTSARSSIGQLSNAPAATGCKISWLQYSPILLET